MKNRESIDQLQPSKVGRPPVGRPELLAPAGSFESMKAAITAGADAVYIGGSRFGARAYADNPGEEQMLEAIDYAHLHGAALYMTVNTLVKERELDELYPFLLPYYERGLDAVIVQDLGVLAAVRRWFPDLPVHASTQMTITGAGGAQLLKDMGAVRVVTARELSLEELKVIHENVDIEIESFVHGALCYCYSGQCLLSSLIGGRSGNRGRCAQPCRLPYEVKDAGHILSKPDERYIMSLKDLCTLDILPDILESGVYSLKIEGRMKSPRYTAGVVSIYRKYVDMYMRGGRGGYHVDENDKKLLLDLFDRGGHTEGYYRKHNGKDMLALHERPAFRPANQELFDALDRDYVNAEKKEWVSGQITAKAGMPLRLELWTKPRRNPSEKYRTVSAADTGHWSEAAADTGHWSEAAADTGHWSEAASDTGHQTVPAADTDANADAGLKHEIRIQTEGMPVQEAQNQPVTAERVEKQLRKTGGTPFVFDTLDVCTEGNVFVPVQALNELRRDGLSKLEAAILKPYRRRAEVFTGAESSGSWPKPLGEPDSPAAWQERTAGTLRSAGRRLSGFEEPQNLRLHVLVSNEEQLRQALKEQDIAEIQLESDAVSPDLWKAYVLRCHGCGKRAVLAMPMIFRTKAEEFFGRWGKVLTEAGFDGFLVRSLEEAVWLRKRFARSAEAAASDQSASVGVIARPAKAPAPDQAALAGVIAQSADAAASDLSTSAGGASEITVCADHNLYAWNHEAAEMLSRIGFSRLTFPLELNGRELEELGRISQDFELIAYGKLPVMTTAQCVRRTVSVCDGRSGLLFLKDRTGKELPVYNHCAFCFNSIYNPAPLSLLGMEETVRRLRPAALRLQFLTETPEEMSAVIRAYRSAYLRTSRDAEETRIAGAAHIFATPQSAEETRIADAVKISRISRDIETARDESRTLMGEFTRGHMKRGVE